MVGVVGRRNRAAGARHQSLATSSVGRICAVGDRGLILADNIDVVAGHGSTTCWPTAAPRPDLRRSAHRLDHSAGTETRVCVAGKRRWRAKIPSSVVCSRSVNIGRYHSTAVVVQTGMTQLPASCPGGLDHGADTILDRRKADATPPAAPPSCRSVRAAPSARPSFGADVRWATGARGTSVAHLRPACQDPSLRIGKITATGATTARTAPAPTVHHSRAAARVVERPAVLERSAARPGGHPKPSLYPHLEDSLLPSGSCRNGRVPGGSRR